MIRRSILGAAVLALVTGAAGAARAQCDTTFTLENRSGIQINELYFSSSRNSEWGNDRLGQNVLAAGASVRYQPRPGGAYDFRVVFANGRAVERRNVDLCSVSTVTVTAQGISAQ